MGRAEPEVCHSASASSSGMPNIRPSMTRFARLKEKRCRDSEPSPEKLSGTAPFFRCAPGWLRSDPKIFPTNHRDSTLLCPRPRRGDNPPGLRGASITVSAFNPQHNLYKIAALPLIGLFCGAIPFFQSLLVQNVKMCVLPRYTARTYPHTVLSVSVRHSLLLLSAVCAVHG